MTNLDPVGSVVADVILPVLNEIDAIEWVLSRVPAGYRPIVVDNGSTDGSAELARSLGALVVEEPRRGFGAACFSGLSAAEAPIVCFMDCDGSLDPLDLPLVANAVASDRTDLMLGARAAAKGAWPTHARLANRWLAREVRRRHRLSLTDLGPMRAARREPLVGLALKDRRSGWPLEMVLRAAESGWRINEVAVPYRPRTGKSKVTGTVRGTVTAVTDMRRQLRDLSEQP